ncbi:hypothetical protein K2X14_04485 [Acetobacter sp. TBRC 12305]|uniref:Uncharacterized protein n=1 Tax=Acetobacter garciniae TaxID=2817435 RepID=A0A939KLM8_9PROT|nr:hypothetical protein [Acetobacter garciniae]MBO1324413.1 hypothetical protein [Acetobacter garciniae]MBX0344102.1 hypothetical protein [Acetobacter garciniae]
MQKFVVAGVAILCLGMAGCSGNHDEACGRDRSFSGFHGGGHGGGPGGGGLGGFGGMGGMGGMGGGRHGGGMDGPSDHARSDDAGCTPRNLQAKGPAGPHVPDHIKNNDPELSASDITMKQED